jgi:hypothetical protein
VYVLENGMTVMEPLVCWALVEDDATGQTSVVGMVVEEYGIGFAQSSDFLGYNYPGCRVNWEELAQVRQEKQA